MLDTERLNHLVYVHYNLKLWVKQYERKVDVTTISLDEIDTTGAWSVESEEPVMEVALDWLEVDHFTDSDHGDDTKALDEDIPVLEEFHIEFGSVPQSDP